MVRIFLVFLMLLLVSCSKSLDIQLDPYVNVFLSKDSGKNIRLTPKDKEYVALNKWLSKHNSSWQPTSGRYRGGVYLTSGSYGIQITETHVVLYSDIYNEPKAVYIQKVGKDKLSGIRNVGKKLLTKSSRG